MEKRDIIPILIVVAIAIVAFNLDTITGKEIAPRIVSFTVSPGTLTTDGDVTITVDYIGRIENNVQILYAEDERRRITWLFDNCGSADLCIQRKSPATLTKYIEIDRTDLRTTQGSRFKPGDYIIRINDRWGVEIARKPFTVE